MFHFSTKSKNILNSVNPKLQKLFNEVIKYYDISIISGFRTVEEQQELFKQNRSKCDGINKISKHQTRNAVDIVPYPINWEDINKFHEVAGCIKTIANQQGLKIIWGVDWKSFKDFPHWEIED